MLFRRRTPLSPGERFRRACWPVNGWKRSMRYVAKRILRLSGSPHAIAAGFAAGVFSSFTPFVGFHFLFSFGVAFLVGGNMFAAAFGTAVGNPLTFPLIWFSSYEVGNFLLRAVGDAPSHEVAVGLAGQPLAALGPFLMPLTLGSLPLGVGFAALAYCLARWAVTTYQAARRRRLKARRAGFGTPGSGISP